MTHSPAEIETLAVALYESDCRQRAGDVAKRSTLSHVRAYLGFPAWTTLPVRGRNTWRGRAAAMIGECGSWNAEEAEWDAAGGKAED